MRYFKLGYDIIIHKFWFHLLIILEMAAMLVLTNTVIATYNSRQMLYAPYRDILTQKGVVLMLNNHEEIEMMNNEDIQAILERNNDMLNYTELLELFRQKLKGDNLQIRYTIREILTAEGPKSQMKGNGAEAVCYYFLDHTVFEGLRMPLAAGRWASSDKTQNGETEIVISGGTDAQLNQVYSTSVGKFKVVGILTDNTYIPPGPFMNNTDNTNFMSIFDYYEPFDRNVSQRSPFAIADQNAYQTRSGMEPDNALFISYGNISDEDFDANNKYLRKFGMIRNINGEESFQTVAEQSEKALNEIYTRMLPIVLAAAVVVLAGLIGSVAISTVREKKNFGIHFLCGCRWKDCTKIILAYLTILFAAAVVLTLLSILVMKFINMDYIIGTVYGWNNLLVSFVEIAAMYLLAVILPHNIIKSSSPVETIKEC